MTAKGTAKGAGGSNTPTNSTRLQIATDFSLPLDAVTETFAILAKRRSGKSNAAAVMAEEMYAAGQHFVTVDAKGDWWGLRAPHGNQPGLAVVVFGGLHGDVPLEPSSGRVVAELIVEHRLTCVLDVSEMSRGEQRRFLADFAETLYRKNRLPIHVIAEEADTYLPQRVTAGDARLVGAWENLIKRGGFRGIGLTLISQRSASLNKDALTQVETLIAMRTPSPQDRKAILAWMDQHETGHDAVNELPTLADGEAWVFSPQWLRTLTKIRFRRRRTFDSGATPKVGGAVPRPPTQLAEIDLDAIRVAMADTIERANADSPTELRHEIKRLRAQLAAAQAVPAPASRIERVEVPVLDAATLAAAAAAADRLEAACTAQAEQLAQAQQTLEATLAAIADIRHRLDSTSAAAATPPAAVTDRRRPEAGAKKPARTAATTTALAAPTTAPDVPEIELRKGARRMIESLARMAPLRLTKAQWGTVARLKTSGGTWSTYLSDIRRAGLLDENAAGYTLSTAGFAYLGDRPDPLTATELQDHYRAILRSGAAKMLDELIAAHPDGLTRDQLGDRAGLAVTGGTFSTYLSDLTRNGLAERRADLYRATDILIYGSAAD